MNPDKIRKLDTNFNVDTSYLPDRFTVIGAVKVRDNDYVVIGMETTVEDKDSSYCSWLYNPDCGFIYGHYRLTRAEAFHDLVNRG